MKIFQVRGYDDSIPQREYHLERHDDESYNIAFEEEYYKRVNSINTKIVRNYFHSPYVQ